MLVKSRQVQGWNLQEPKDAKLTASVWKEQLDRHGVRHELYPKLVDMGVDHRIKQIAAGKDPSPFSVELIIAMHGRYRAEKLEELQRLQREVEYYTSLRHRVAIRELSVDAALQLVANFTDQDVVDWNELIDSIITGLQDKVARFHEEHYL